MANELRTNAPEPQNMEVPGYSDGFAAHVPKYKRTRAWTWIQQSQFGGFVRGLKGCTREFAALLNDAPVVVPDVSQLTASLGALQWNADDKTNREAETREDAP